MIINWHTLLTYAWSVDGLSDTQLNSLHMRTGTQQKLPLVQLKWCCSNHGQNADWSSMAQNMLVKLSSLTIWSIFWHCTSGLEEVWKSWATAVGLADGGKRVLLVWWVDRGLSMAGVLEISNLMSELFSLLLLLEPSVSLLRLMDSVGSLVFNANIYNSTISQSRWWTNKY